MGFNNGLEKRKFEKHWAGLREEYAEAGMSEEAIAQMHEFDKSALLSNRRFYEKTVLCHDYHTEDDRQENQDHSLRLKAAIIKENMESFTTEIPEVIERHKFDWMHRIECGKLHECLVNLPSRSKDILTLMAFGNLSQKEVAEHMGIPSSTLHDWLNVIRKEIGTYLIEGMSTGKYEVVL